MAASASVRRRGRRQAVPIGRSFLLRKQFGDLGYGDEQPMASFDKKSESVELIELCCSVVLGTHHEGVGCDGVPQHAAEGVEEHELAMSLPLMARIHRQAPHQCRRHDRIARQALRKRLGQLGKSDAGRRKRVIADRNVAIAIDQNEA